MEHSKHVQTSSLRDTLKNYLLKFAVDGIDKVFVDRKRLKNNSLVNKVSKQSMSSDYKNRTILFDDINEWGSSNVTLQENANYLGLKFISFFSILVMKFMGFQFNILVNFFTFPIWLSYFSFMFLMFPFKTISHVRGYFTRKVLRVLCIARGRVIGEAQKSMGNIAIRFACGFFWSSYVFLVLLSLLISGFIFGGLVIRILVQNPVQEKELNFDYQKANPVASVPIMPYSGLIEPTTLVTKEIGARVVPHNHKLQLTVSLTVPESEYNRKLGIFQVRVEFISVTGKITASSRQTCMLRFKSQPIRTVETIIQSASVIAGFKSSESQILEIKMNSFIEGLEPTAYMKVILESRAEYNKLGAGIPEIYKASLSLESHLTPLKRLIWNWRRTIFVWTSIILFLTELTCLLVCCRPMVIPRRRPMLAYVKKEPLNIIR